MVRAENKPSYTMGSAPLGIVHSHLADHSGNKSSSKITCSGELSGMSHVTPDHHNMSAETTVGEDRETSPTLLELTPTIEDLSVLT